jgi:hypothetical protein
VCLEASTKPHVHQKFEIFWTNIASAMGCPNSKNKPKKGLRPLGVKECSTHYIAHRRPHPSKYDVAPIVFKTNFLEIGKAHWNWDDRCHFLIQNLTFN